MKHLARSDLSGMHCSASFSDCERYRYLLTWRWSDAPLLVAWMLNPSTATHEVLDPTITGLVTRARAWGRGGVRVINLFALRATDPEVMKHADDSVGPDNDEVTKAALAEAHARNEQVICGWGKHGSHRNRDLSGLVIARDLGVQLYALATNKDGSPRHPLYIAHSQPARRWQQVAGSGQVLSGAEAISA